MKVRKTVLLIILLLLMAGTAGALLWLKSSTRLGPPGIKALPLDGMVMMKIDLPERVLDFSSTNVPESEQVLGYLPKDTSFAQRFYQAPDGFYATAFVVLMGTDRTSIHKADYCLAGAGWRTDQKAVAEISVGGSRPYSLPVAKWSVSRVVQNPDGTKVKQNGVCVFWFVADTSSTPSYFSYKCTLMWDLLRTGILQRWAYVSYFAQCQPGEEDAVFARLSQLIAASVPEFQLPPRPLRVAKVAEH